MHPEILTFPSCMSTARTKYRKHPTSPCSPGNGCLCTTSTGRPRSRPMTLTSSLWKSLRGSTTRPFICGEKGKTFAKHRWKTKKLDLQTLVKREPSRRHNLALKHGKCTNIFIIYKLHLADVSINIYSSVQDGFSVLGKAHVCSPSVSQKFPQQFQCSSDIFTQKQFLSGLECELLRAVLVCSFQMKSRKWQVYDVSDTCQTCHHCLWHRLHILLGTKWQHSGSWFCDFQTSIFDKQDEKLSENLLWVCVLFDTP